MPDESPSPGDDEPIPVDPELNPFLPRTPVGAAQAIGRRFLVDVENPPDMTDYVKKLEEEAELRELLSDVTEEELAQLSQLSDATEEELALIAKVSRAKDARLGGFRALIGQPIESTEPLVLIVTQLERLAEFQQARARGEDVYEGRYTLDLIGHLTEQLLPVFSHERFRAYCEDELGTYPTGEAARRLLGRLKRRHGLSEREANGLTLDAALDIVERKPEHNEADQGRGNPDGQGSKLKPCEAKAWQSYIHAINEDSSLKGASYKDVHLWIEENGAPQYSEGHKLPNFDTWDRHRRAGERKSGQPSRYARVKGTGAGRRINRKGKKPLTE
jgi:hypothetical protein